MAKSWSPPYKDIELLAAQALSVREMCAQLGVSEKVFYAHQRKSRKLKAALATGRSWAISQCAIVVMQGIQGTLGGEKQKDGKTQELKTWNKKQEIQVGTAMKYLQLHGDLWKHEQKVNHMVGGTVKHAGTINVDVEHTIDDSTALRMSAAFLKSRGVQIGEMPEPQQEDR